MNYLNQIRENGLFDYIIIISLSTFSLSSKELIFIFLISILNYIYNIFIPQKINNYVNKEYIAIIIKILYYINIIKNSNINKLILLFLIFLYLCKLLTKIKLGSKLLISNFILNEIKNEGKYLSENFITGNAVEFFIIESLFLSNTILLIMKNDKNLLDYFFIVLGNLPLYSILKNFFYLWHHFVQCLYIFFCTKTILFFFYWFFILECFFYLNNYYIPKIYLKKIIKRKIYHFLGFIVLVPGIMLLDKTILKLILMIVSYIFIVVEILRNMNKINEFTAIQNLNNFMLKSIDERDDGNFIITHTFLMTGLISSLYYDDNKNQIFNYLSVIVLCIGDSMCSICGVLFGKNKIYSLNDRTLEGTLGGLISSSIIYMILKGSIINRQEFIQFIFIFLYEGYTLEIDNLVLPLFANNLFLKYNLIENHLIKIYNYYLS